jgi:hypothetical protein
MPRTLSTIFTPPWAIGLTHTAGGTGEKHLFVFKTFHPHLAQTLHVSNVECLAGLARNKPPGAKIGTKAALHAPVEGLRAHFGKVIPHFQ